jgi:hypothetical protein
MEENDLKSGDKIEIIGIGVGLIVQQGCFIMWKGPVCKLFKNCRFRRKRR